MPTRFPRTLVTSAPTSKPPSAARGLSRVPRVYLAAIAFAMGLVSAPSTLAAEVWVGGYGSKTCGDALALSERDRNFHVLFTDYVQAYMTALNYRGGKMVGHSVSGDTLEQLWAAKCRTPANITRPFFVIADEIYTELEANKQ